MIVSSHGIRFLAPCLGPFEARIDDHTLGHKGRTVSFVERATVTHEEVRDVMGAPESIYHRGARIVTHPCATDQVRITGFLDDLLGPGRSHHFHYLVFTEFD